MSACRLDVLCDPHLVSQGLHVVLLQPLDTGSRAAEAREDQRGAVRVYLCRGHLHHLLPLPTDTEALADKPGSWRSLHRRQNQLYRTRCNQRFTNQHRTDAILVSIPVPLLAKVRLALRRKLVIGVLLCGGVFVMCATLLRCVLSLQSINSINTSTIWAIRETFVAIIAINAPCIKPLFSTSVWLGSSKDPSSKNAHRYGRSGPYSLSVFGKSKPDPLTSHTSKLGDHASEEFILRDQNAPAFVNDVSGGHGRRVDEESGNFGEGIQVTTMYEVKRGGLM